MVNLKLSVDFENKNFVLVSYFVFGFIQISQNGARKWKVCSRNTYLQKICIHDALICRQNCKIEELFQKRRISFLGDVKGKKQDFRRLTKQFSLDTDDNFTILKTMRITQSEYIFWLHLSLHARMYVCVGGWHWNKLSYNYFTDDYNSCRLFYVYGIMPHNYKQSTLHRTQLVIDENEYSLLQTGQVPMYGSL